MYQAPEPAYMLEKAKVYEEKSKEILDQTLAFSGL